MTTPMTTSVSGMVCAWLTGKRAPRLQPTAVQCLPCTFCHAAPAPSSKLHRSPSTAPSAACPNVSAAASLDMAAMGLHPAWFVAHVSSSSARARAQRRAILGFAWWVLFCGCRTLTCPAPKLAVMSGFEPGQLQVTGHLALIVRGASARWQPPWISVTNPRFAAPSFRSVGKRPAREPDGHPCR